MLLIVKKEHSTYEIFFKRQLICIFHDNGLDVSYYFANGSELFVTDNLHEMIRGVKFYLNNRTEVSNAG